jgi:hypothetical protein
VHAHARSIIAGFPFTGNTGFGAMAAHIPDDGYCLIVYGPHVGVAADDDKILESLVSGTPTNAIQYLTKTGSCSKVSFSRPQLAHAIRRIATQTE